MNKKIAYFAIFLFVFGLIGDQITTRFYLQYMDESNGNPSNGEDIPKDYPPLWEKKAGSNQEAPLILPKVELNTWIVYDIAIACFATLVTFVLLSQKEDYEYLRVVSLVFLFFILISATIKIANTFTNIQGLFFKP
jgi:hypothetical protein